MQITVEDALKYIFSNEDISFVSPDLKKILLNLEELTDLDLFIYECVKETKDFKVSGPHRYKDWEKGWSGNGVFYSENEAYDNLPYYFKNNTHIRLREKVFKDLKGFGEVDLLRALQQIIFKKYLKFFNTKNICEYGCGTGSNIQFLKKNLLNLTFYATDWVESACLKIVQNQILPSDRVKITNFFDPNTYYSPSDQFLAFTNAALEQSGDMYKDFINFLIGSKNCIGGIHIEPIRELLNLNVKINRQSFDYAKKRGYLTNFYSFMSKINNIEILLAKDYGLGSKYINGYQILIWKKL